MSQTVIYYKMGQAGILLPINVCRERMRALLVHVVHHARDTDGVCEALGYYRMDVAEDEAKVAGLIGLAQHIHNIIEDSPVLGIHVAAFDREG